jgi:hypothetical protein
VQRRASIDPNPAHPLPYAHSFRPSHTGPSGGSSPSDGASPSESSIFSDDSTGETRTLGTGCGQHGRSEGTMPAQRLGRRPERHAASTAPKRLTTPSTALRGHTRSSVQTHNTEHGAPGSAPVTCYTTPSIALRGHTRSSVKRCTGRSELRLEQSGPTAARAR